MSTTKTPLALPEGYADGLVQLKAQIAQARQRAALAVNAELVPLCTTASATTSWRASRRMAGAPR